jgi:hypothetical protein
VHGNGPCLLVDGGNEVIGGRDESAVFKAEEDVERAVVDGGDAPDGLATLRLENVEANNGRPRETVFGVVCEFTGKIDIASSEFPRTFLTVDAFEFYDGCGIVTETVFLDKERYEDAINVEDEIIGFDTVKHIIVERERDIPLDTMAFA